MPGSATSRNLRTATELTLVADIKPGFVQTTDLMSYVSRLGLLLNVLFELRKRSVERQSSGYAGPLEKLRSLHFVRWSIIENGRKLLLGVSFDRAWEPYIRGIVDEAGPFLDVIFCHCVGYEGHSTADGYAAFAEWVRARQVEVPFFYAGAPDTTVDDLRYLREFERRRGDPTGLVIGEPGTDGMPPVAQATPVDLLERLMRASAALGMVRPYFPPGPEEDFFDRAAIQLLEGLVPRQPNDTIETALAALPGELRKQLTDMHKKLAEPVKLPAEAEVDLIGDLQGNVLTGYQGMTHGCLAFLRFDTKDAIRRFLARVTPMVTTDARAADATWALNVSLTLNGLRTLGLSEGEIGRFPKEFREGMEARAGHLGDIAEEHPSRWDLPLHDGQQVLFSSVDLVLSLQARLDKVGDTDHLWTSAHPLAGDLEKVITGEGAQRLFVEPLLRPRHDDREQLLKEHFGFLDGVSQPVATTRVTAKTSKRDRVALGELVLGYRDGRGETQPASDGVLLRHGSFLVLRKLEQHVDAFEDFVKTSSDEKSGLTAEVLYAKLMGRDREGNPLVPEIENEPPNSFDYAADPRGDACPLHSHVRRTNPREPEHKSIHGLPVQTPRIARRGFSFGPLERTTPGPRGLLFMAYNASIADQFEILQRWVNGGNSSGDLSAHADPVVSHAHGCTISIRHEGTPHRLEKTKPFVTLRWGTYLFTPSVSALKTLATRTAQDDEAAGAADRERLIAEGRDIIEGLDRLTRISGPEAGKTAWKLILEDRLVAAKRRAVWAAIRSRGGALRTPYGVLVGSAEGVVDVLADGEGCSVRKYYQRMSESVGPLYLGMDRCPVHHQGAKTPEDEQYEQSVTEGMYERQATEPNRYMAGITRAEAFADARQAAEMALAKVATPVHELLPKKDPVVNLRLFAGGAISLVSRKWFGLPSNPEDPSQLRNVFLVAAQNIFYPHPEPIVTTQARRIPAQMPALEQEAVGLGPDMLQYLPSFDEAERQRALVGGAQGFLVATMASFVNVMQQLLDDGHAFRMAHWLRSAPGRKLAEDTTPEPELLRDDVLFVAEALSALKRAPQPDILHRTAVQKKSLAGGAEFANPGDTVVVSLASAVADQPDGVDLLFGGRYGTGPTHACPGKEAAIGVILGLLVTLLTKKKVRSESTLTITYDT